MFCTKSFLVSTEDNRFCSLREKESMSTVSSLLLTLTASGKHVFSAANACKAPELACPFTIATFTRIAFNKHEFLDILGELFIALCNWIANWASSFTTKPPRLPPPLSTETKFKAPPASSTALLATMALATAFSLASTATAILFCATTLASFTISSKDLPLSCESQTLELSKDVESPQILASFLALFLGLLSQILL
uniref:Uncharacterized protein n=1 Tax=Opuntia streptacantha TaxID=393608 RepID=A0A7C8YWB1_OPUST